MCEGYIFLGPSLPLPLIEENLGLKVDDSGILSLGNKSIQIMPPVAEGDVLRVLKHRPQIIGIVDGYFESVPSVWHKEILYAMSKGTHVLGAASMGALRAAELGLFGMEGVGVVFQSFADGDLQDDDEVAVIHGPVDLGFPSLSEALVNIRCTLEHALIESVVDQEMHDAMLKTAKNMYYKHRSYGNIVRAIKEIPRYKKKIGRFLEWLPHGKRDQKKADAIELVKKVAMRIVFGIEPKKVLYNFENSQIWQNMRSCEP